MNLGLKSWILAEKFEIAVIITVSIILFFIGEWIKGHSAEHQDLAAYLPYLAILGGMVLFLIQLFIMQKKINELKVLYDSQITRDKIFYGKLVLITFSAVVFLFADLVVAYSLAMSYFVFGFGAGTSQFPQAWNQLHIAEIMFPILSLISLWCISRK